MSIARSATRPTRHGSAIVVAPAARSRYLEKWGLLRLHCGLLQELQQQAADLGGLLLLHPVAGTLDQVSAEHAGAGALLHRLVDTGALIDAPILFSCDETGGHIDGAARPYLQFGCELA